MLRGSKCHLNTTRLDVLGFSIQAGAITPQESKAEVVRAFSLPRSKKQLQGYLSLLEWHHEHAKVSSDMLHEFAGLTDMVRGTARTLHWSADQIAMFHASKRWIENTMLVTPGCEDRITLYTDASLYAVGGAVTCGKGVVAYYHKKLTPCQVNWSTTCREFYGLVLGLLKCERWLPGWPNCHIELRCDNLASSLLADQSLTKLHKVLENISTRRRWMRWFEVLLCFPALHCAFLPGDQNTAADFWSRLPELHTTCREHTVECE